MFEFVLSNWDAILVAITGLISAASAIAALTPSTADDGVILTIRKVVDMLALNVGHAAPKGGAKK